MPYALGDDGCIWPSAPWNCAELEQRHEAVQRAFPGGLEYEAFVYLTLESAREVDDICHPPSIALAGHGHENSATWRMWLRQGLIEHRGGHNAPMRWYITEKGRTALANLRPKYDAVWKSVYR